jgi:hypothetical protein
MQDYISTSGISISMTSYTSALENYIDWINTDGSNCFINNGDGVSATYNRLVYQIAELVEVYNKGDPTINLNFTTVRDYFDSSYYDKLITIATYLFTNEITNDSMKITYENIFDPNAKSLKIYYLDGSSESNGSYTYQTNSGVFSGYTRMISYCLMISDNYIQPQKRNQIVPLTGTWPGKYIQVQENIDYTYKVWVPDPSKSPEIDTIGSGMSNLYVALITIDNNTNKLSYAYKNSIAGYFKIITNADGSYASYSNLTIYERPTYPTGPGTDNDYRFELYYCNKIPTTKDDVLAPVYYVENMSLDELVGENGIDLNLYEQVTLWENDKTNTHLIDYFKTSEVQYKIGGISWATKSSPYFAWAMFTLHMSNYRLNH